MRKVSLILAADSANCIAINDNIPWKIKDDMQFFKETTTGHHVIMGRKTARTFKKALPNRINWVLTRNPDECLDLTEKGFLVKSSLLHIISQINAQSNPENTQIFIIGGAEIYKLALDSDVVDEVFLTRVHSFNSFNIDDSQQVKFNLAAHMYGHTRRWEAEIIKTFDKNERNEHTCTVIKYSSQK